MRPINAASAADNYVSGMQNGVKKYKDGVNAVTESPMAKAAQNLEKAKRNYIARIDSGQVAARLNAIPLELWKQNSVKKADRLASGAQEAKNKVRAYYDAKGPAMDQLRAQIHAMPNETPADSEARQLAWSRGMRAIAGRS